MPVTVYLDLHYTRYIPSVRFHTTLQIYGFAVMILSVVPRARGAYMHNSNFRNVQKHAAPWRGVEPRFRANVTKYCPGMTGACTNRYTTRDVDYKTPKDTQSMLRLIGGAA